MTPKMIVTAGIVFFAFHFATAATADQLIGQIDQSTPVLALPPGSIQIQQTSEGDDYRYHRWPLQDGKPSGVFGVKPNIDPSKPVCFMTGEADSPEPGWFHGTLKQIPFVGGGGWIGMYFGSWAEITLYCQPANGTTLILKDIQDSLGELAPVTIVN